MQMMNQSFLANILPMPYRWSAWKSIEDPRYTTSKHAIMMPQAGAILAVRGNIPANKALVPSVRSIRKQSGMVAVSLGESVPDISNACRLVFRTSKGDVMRDAVVPLMAPLANATYAPDWPRDSKNRFQAS